MNKSTDISKIDSNFATPNLEGDWEWITIDPSWIQNQGWPEESEPFTRFPNRARELLTNENLWVLSRHSAGLTLEFTTNTPSLAAQWRVIYDQLALMHMPATGVSGLDFYSKEPQGWQWASIARPAEKETSTLVFDKAEAIDRHFRMYLPLYNGVEAIRLGIRPGSAFKVVPPKPFEITLYGTSIVQGGCASRPGMGYSALLERRLGVGIQNLGFSGNGRAEPETAHLIGEMKPKLFLIDCLPNIPPEKVESDVIPFLEVLLEKQPKVPIAMVDIINIGGQFQSSRMEAFKMRRKGFINVRRYFEEGRHASRFTWISGDMLGSDDEGTVDGTHPTDVGFMRIADHLAAAVRHFLQRVDG